jgi:hypothetical protein
MSFMENRPVHRMAGKKIHWCSLALLFISSCFGKQVNAQQSNTSAERKRLTPNELPGNGAQQYDFFYAGESKTRNMYIVRKGKITWSYIDTTGKGEISDAILMANGNILFAHQFGITLINQDKQVLWHYDAPEGFETHTAEPIGDSQVVFVQNGNPPKVFVMDIRTNTVEKEFSLPFKSGTHGQIRHARLTKRGTLLVAHMDLGKVCEYDLDGHQLSSIDVPAVWSAVPLNNGNILVTSNQGFVSEITTHGDSVWKCSLKDIPGYTLNNPQLAVRLANGNTLVNNWFNQWSGTLDPDNPPVQAVELTPGNQIVWALRSWTPPLNLGPSTTIQILNDSTK